MSGCTARIRPFLHETILDCELPEGHDGRHEGAIRDYAYPGSMTKVTWAEDDRRTFRGEWAACPEGWQCILPANHAGRHAL